MQINLKTLVTAIVGTAAFESGLDRVLNHSDTQAWMSWPLFLVGILFLALVCFDLVAAYKLSR